MMNATNMIQLSSHQPRSFSLLQESTLGNSGTGEFDFLSALLGLQTSSEGSSLQLFEQGLVKADSNSEILDGDKALLEVFGKKKGFDELNPQILVFGGSPSAENFAKTANPIAQDLSSDSLGKGTDTHQLNLTDLFKDHLKDQVQDPFEDPLEKLKFDASLKSQSEKSPFQALQQKSKQVAAFQSAFNVSAQEIRQPERATEIRDQALSGEIIRDPMGKLNEAEELDHEIKRKDNRENETFVSESFSERSMSVDTHPALQISEKKSAPVSVPEVFQKVDSLVHSGGGKMTVFLTPPDLGQVEIQVVTKGKNVEVKVKSDNDFAKMAIEGQVADLQQSLQNQDLNLSKIEVQVTREMSPSFMENQFAGFFQNGSNPYQNSGAFQERDNLGTPWERKSLGSQSKPMVTASSALRPEYREAGRVDIRI
jgi:hypothetical protein